MTKSLHSGKTSEVPTMSEVPMIMISNLKNERGAAAAVVNVLMLILIVAGLYGSIAYNHSRQVARIRISSFNLAKTDLKSQIRSYMANFRALNNSLSGTGNTDFRKCVLGEGRCVGGRHYDFTLLPPYGSTPRFAGPENRGGALFDRLGNPCTLPAAQCPLEVDGQFVATCPNQAASCNLAENVKMIFKVKVNPKFLAAGKSQFIVASAFSETGPDIPVSQIAAVGAAADGGSFDLIPPEAP
jgi:hypothetical protein